MEDGKDGGMRHPESEFFPSRITEFKYFNPKLFYPGSAVFPSWIQGHKDSRIRIKEF
jgi:hypothetical protein